MGTLREGRLFMVSHDVVLNRSNIICRFPVHESGNHTLIPIAHEGLQKSLLVG